MNEQDIFLQVLKQPDSAGRQQLLDHACDGQSLLRERVEILLRAHERAGEFLESPAAGVATAEYGPTVETPGTIIGPYKLLQEIGEGGMGVVYMAEQQEPMRRRVALKIIKPGMDSRQVIARFEAERQALAMMDHQNIAKVLDAGTVGEPEVRSQMSEVRNDQQSIPLTSNLRPLISTAGRPYFVMELVHGVPITEYCEKNRLTPRERLELFVPICLAIQHAHQKGIIHRDIKPSNILVTMYDDKPVPKVIDFGVAKAVEQRLTDKTLFTQYGTLVGTFEYMSPEQAQMNAFGVDTRSDIYSLGVLLYELLTGTTPFDRERLKSSSFDEIRRIIREEEPETVSQRIARTRRVGQGRPSGRLPTEAGDGGPALASSLVPPYASPRLSELDWIVAKSLEKDRSRRYESASALAADIQRYLSDEPVLACPPTAMYRFQKFARKHKASLSTAATIAVCLLLGTTVSAWQAVRATTAEVQANANANQAQEKAKEATDQRDEAQRQRDEVKALADKLAAKELQLERTLYTAHINLAHNAWNAANIRRVTGLLAQHLPKPGETDLRGFEWHYLNKLCHPEVLSIPRQGGGIAFSPDGKRLACGDKSWDETKKAFGGPEVKICDTLTGKQLLRFKAHCSSLCFSPDDKRLATAGNNELKVWDADTGKEIFNLNGHAGIVNCVAYSPGGRLLASGSAGWALREEKWLKVPSQVKIWDAATGKELLTATGHSGNVECIAFSPDGERLASGSEDGSVKFWNVQTGQELLSFKPHEEVISIAFSPDGKRLVSGGFQGMKVWDAQTGQELLTVKGAKGEVNSVAVSPDGKRLACTSFNKAVQVWDAETGDEVFTFRGHTGWVSNVTFSPDGTRLASTGNGDSTVRIWDLKAGQLAEKFSDGTFRRKSIGISADGKRVTGMAYDSATRGSTIKVWNIQSGQELVSIKLPRGNSPGIVRLSPDSKRLATGDGVRHETKDEWITGEVKLWDAETGRELATLKNGKWPVVDLAFSPDSSRLVGCGSRPNGDGNDQSGYPCEVKIWDVASGKELLSINGHQSLVNAVAYSPDGNRLATLCRDRTVKLWDAQSGREQLSMPVQTSVGAALVFSPDGRRLAGTNKPRGATGPTEGGEIKMWDTQTGQELLTLPGHIANVTSLSFSPDGKRLAAGTGSGPGPSSSHEVKIWDAETGEELLTFPNIGSGGVAFTPDGHRLASGGAEGLKIFDATPVLEQP